MQPCHAEVRMTNRRGLEGGDKQKPDKHKYVQPSDSTRKSTSTRIPNLVYFDFADLDVLDAGSIEMIMTSQRTICSAETEHTRPPPLN